MERFPLTGSAAVAGRLSELLSGAGAAPAGFILRKASISDEEKSILLEFRDAGGVPALVFLRRDRTRGFYIELDNMLISYQIPESMKAAGERYEQSVKLLADSLAPALSGVTLERLADIIAADPAEIGAFPQVLNRYLDVWGHPDQEVQFFFHEAVWRYYFVCFSHRHPGSIGIRGRNTYITHGDAECPRNSTFVIPGLRQFFIFPWAEDSGNGPAGNTGFYATGLRDTDVIMGGAGRLRELLDILGTAGNTGPVLMSETCLSLIIGDDVRPAIRNFQDRNNVPVIHIDASHPYPHEQLAGVLRFPEAPVTGGRNSASVNLIGFPPTNGRRELVALLEKSGVAVNSILLPDLDLDGIPEFRMAGTDVIHPGEMFRDVIDRLMLDPSRKSLTPEAPYGINGTWAFLESVADAAGTLKEFQAFREEHYGEIFSRWRALRMECGQISLGLILLQHQVESFSRNIITWGIPLLQVLEEMGFSLHIMIRRPETGKASPAVERVRGLLDEPDRHATAVFDTADDLGRLLREGEFQAVYSDIFRDRRIAEAGKAQFSINCFEPGLDGAFRSARRLLSICRTTFFRRYGRYLSPGTEA